MTPYDDEERVEHCDLCGQRIMLIEGGIAVDADNPEVEHDCPGDPDAA